MEHGVLKYKNRMVVPRKSSFPAKLMKEYHSSPIGGHSGFLKPRA